MLAPHIQAGLTIGRLFKREQAGTITPSEREELAAARKFVLDWSRDCVEAAVARGDTIRVLDKHGWREVPMRKA